MKKLAAFATTTVLRAIAGQVAASAREAEPRDDHGTTVKTVHVRSATAKAGDDHRRRVERGDDHPTKVKTVHVRSATAKAGDDHGGHGGHGGHGSDD